MSPTSPHPSPGMAASMPSRRRLRWLPRQRPGWAVIVAALCLALIVIVAILAPWLAPHDPLQMSPANRLKPPGEAYWLGSDAYGRDLLSRVLYGARVSLIVGIGSALISVVVGLPLGILAGFFRGLDAVIMRVMDGLMAIPSVLLAIAIVSLVSANLWTVMAAITIPEIPRVVRLVRSVVLSAREEPYVEAAVSLGSSLFTVMWRHLMPNTLAPLIVMSTYICASAILTEAILSFLGAGIGTETPTWGNIMAEGRTYFLIKPSLIFWPGILLSICILSINLLGDAARDRLDPRLQKRGAVQ